MVLEWTAVFEGDVWRVKILQLELEGEGIATFVPDASFPSQDPHSGGTPTPASALFVHAADAARARERIRESSKAT